MFISRSSLKIHLGDKAIDDVFVPTIPHIRRLESLVIQGKNLPRVLEHFRSHTPLLEKMDICIDRGPGPALDDALFNGDLSSLRELHLSHVIPGRICQTSEFSKFTLTPLLDLFESAPLLHTIRLWGPIEDLPGAPVERIVPLRRQKFLIINEGSPHSTILHHIHLPMGHHSLRCSTSRLPSRKIL